MNKNIVIAIVLSGIVIAGSTYLQYKFYPPTRTPEPAVETAVEQPAISQHTSFAETDAAPVDIIENNIESVTQEQLVTIKTSVAEITFTNWGWGYHLL